MLKIQRQGKVCSTIICTLWPFVDKISLMVEPTDIFAFKQQIIDEMAELEKLRKQARDSRAPVCLDQQSIGRLSRIDSMQQQAMNIASDSRRLHRQKALMAALQRIEIENYGYCHNCDDVIGAGRLRIDPAVTLCVNCA